MRDWARFGENVAGVLPKVGGRSCALIHESTFFPQVYCIRIQIYDEVKKDSRKIRCYGQEM